MVIGEITNLTVESLDLVIEDDTTSEVELGVIMVEYKEVVINKEMAHQSGIHQNLMEHHQLVLYVNQYIIGLRNVLILMKTR